MDEFPYRRRCDRRVSSNNHGAGWGIQPCQRLITEGRWDTETEIEDAADRMTGNTYA